MKKKYFHNIILFLSLIIFFEASALSILNPKKDKFNNIYGYPIDKAPKAYNKVNTKTLNNANFIPHQNNPIQTIQQFTKGKSYKKQKYSPLKFNKDNYSINLRKGIKTPRHIKAVKQKISKNIKKIKTNKEKKIIARNFLSSAKGILRIKNPDKEFILFNEENDNLGIIHLKYYQEYNNINIWPCQIIVHINQFGEFESFEGAYIPTPDNMILNPVVTEHDAIIKACSKFSYGNNYKITDSELIIYAPLDKPPRLAWKIKILFSIYDHWLIIIDAFHGNSLLAYNMNKTSNVEGSGKDLTGITRSLNLWNQEDSYYMIDTSKSMYSQYSKPPDIEQTNGAIIILDASNQPPTSDVQEIPELNHIKSENQNNWLADGVSLAYNLSKTYDYYQTVHNRNSIDNNGMNIIGVVRLGLNWFNAFWAGDLNILCFGDQEPLAAALDVIAHEFTHGVTQYSSNLIYQNQSGALNEFFSDFFGEMVEARTNGSCDWIVGSYPVSSPLRNIKKPSSMISYDYNIPYPENMSDYYYTSDDYGGVHFNCTIPEYACYLIAEGSDGAIGINDTEQIAYRALTKHLVSNSQFIDLRFAFLSSAEELYGEDSNQYIKIAQVFDSIGIIDDSQTSDNSDDLTPVAGQDYTLYLYYDSFYGAIFMGKCEPQVPECETLTNTPVKESRPAITGDGKTVAFINTYNDLCTIDTDGKNEQCLGYQGKVFSVGVSPDSNYYAFILMDEKGSPTNKINVLDIQNNIVKEFELVVPTIDGVPVSTVLFAHILDFTSDGKYLIYDALNKMKFADNTDIGLWSIYAIDLTTEETLTIVPPINGLDIGNPSISQTSDNYITFEAQEPYGAATTIFTLNLLTGEKSKIGEFNTISNVPALPNYNGDDTAIIFTYPDFYQSTGFSLVKQKIKNRLYYVGDANVCVYNAAYGIIFRKGTYNRPIPEINSDKKIISFGPLLAEKKAEVFLNISNTGNGDLYIGNYNISGLNKNNFYVTGSCTGRKLGPDDICKYVVSFLPESAGSYQAEILINSNDKITPELSIQLFGTCINKNESIDLSSIISYLRVCTGIIDPNIQNDFDVNGDNQTGIEEAIHLLELLASK